MNLTRRTDFALRTLMYLGKSALENPGKPVPSAQIAQTFDIPLNHLIKIVNDLSRRGYIRSIRGPGGGVSLAIDPGELRLGYLIEDLQGPMQLHECVNAQGYCVIETICKLRSIFRDADAVQREFLNGHTLADIIPDSQSI
ncbi:MAG: Rrf2 family transcriptional regulator, partial [Verrucomicrobiae bacterium]|nr:Rrf2 family transcriptional regulator [Verrucomicrobiae bacterium]